MRYTYSCTLERSMALLRSNLARNQRVKAETISARRSHALHGFGISKIAYVFPCLKKPPH
jgi:hypothetical protein